ncbi:DUF2249 domain-containing protein [Gorillibacterium massiliense]|uniref:DUF2249 domain-containing protein n=1 Tax=Gorillibacterium massiliense TaxID=1280390 RepID=UPI0004B2C57D|nr:DUF2249 domain-containing protein [Gorillibacterium massiliense]
MGQEGQTIELDVRSELRSKRDPFKMIMDTVKTLNKEDTFVLHATLKPVPLFGIMKLKGYVHKVEKLEADHWVVTFLHKSRKHELGTLDDHEEESNNETPKVESGEEAPNSPSSSGPQVYHLDNRGLEPPQPMVRTLAKLKDAKSGDEVIIHNDRVPAMLLEELSSMGYSYQIDEQPDGSARVHIFKK